jgi:hypothetical protein
MVKPLHNSGDTAAQDFVINMDIPLSPVSTLTYTHAHMQSTVIYLKHACVTKQRVPGPLMLERIAIQRKDNQH